MADTIQIMTKKLICRYNCLWGLKSKIGKNLFFSQNQRCKKACILSKRHFIKMDRQNCRFIQPPQNCYWVEAERHGRKEGVHYPGRLVLGFRIEKGIWQLLSWSTSCKGNLTTAESSFQQWKQKDTKEIRGALSNKGEVETKEIVDWT